MAVGETRFSESCRLFAMFALHHVVCLGRQFHHPLHKSIFHHVEVAEDGPALYEGAELLLQVLSEVNLVDEAVEKLRDMAPVPLCT